MAESTVATVAIRRVTVTTDRAFDDVVAAVYAGLGRVPDFGALVRRMLAADGAERLEAMVARSRAAAV